MWQTYFFSDRQGFSVTDIDCLWQKRLPVMDTYCLWHTDWLWQTQKVCERHSFFLTDTYCLSQTKAVCDRKRLCATDTDCLWQTQTDFDRHRLSVTDIYCLWYTHRQRHRLPVTDTDYLWQTQTVYGRGLLSVQGHTIFTTDILNITACLCISKLGIFYFHTRYQNCKQLFMYMNNWDKGVAPAICPRILTICEYWISAGAAPFNEAYPV